MSDFAYYFIGMRTKDGRKSYKDAAGVGVQVSITCDLIYFDGTETRGTSSVGVVIKHGRYVRTMNFRVWVPQLPLDVVLSDSRLSTITGWKMASSPTRYISG